MTLTRRGFIGGMLAALAAPAVVRAGILMPVKPVIWTPESVIWSPTLPLNTRYTHHANGWLRVETTHPDCIMSAFVKLSEGVDGIPRLTADGGFDWTHLNGGKGLEVREPQTLEVQAIQKEQYIKHYNWRSPPGVVS